jgi:hypothetical protein
MRFLFAGYILSFGLAVGLIHASAQTNAAPSHESWMVSFLTSTEQEKYANARAKALADNPKLKTQGEKLMAQGETLMTSGTTEDKQAFIEKMNSHRQKLREAMLKEDPTLEPIFAQIDKHISEMKAKHVGQGQSVPGGTNAPAATTPSPAR